jgi:hypothetical protein
MKGLKDPCCQMFNNIPLLWELDFPLRTIYYKYYRGSAASLLLQSSKIFVDS